MCGSHDFVEQQAFKMYEQIREQSIYKIVQLLYSDGTVSEAPITEMGLISKMIVEDKAGTHYPVEPNPNGLRFVKGEITYKEYTKLQKSETSNLFIIFFIIIGFFSAAMYFMLKYFS